MPSLLASPATTANYLDHPSYRKISAELSEQYPLAPPLESILTHDGVYQGEGHFLRLREALELLEDISKIHVVCYRGGLGIVSLRLVHFRPILPAQHFAAQKGCV